MRLHDWISAFGEFNSLPQATDSVYFALGSTGCRGSRAARVFLPAPPLPHSISNETVLANATPDIALLTTSHAGDFELCRALCASVDKLMPEMTHYLIVERCDRALFAPLETGRRRILTTESLLPEYIRVRGLNGRRYSMSPYRLKPVRKWIMQQHIKLAAIAGRSEQAIVVTDSDTEFIRPLDPNEIIRNGRTRFWRAPFDVVRKHDIEWAREGARVLNAPEAAEPTMNYVENLIAMDTRVTRMLLQHVGRIAGTSWKRVVTRMEALSEYCLYGQFIDYVPGPHRQLVFADSRVLCHTLHYDFDGTDARAEDTHVRGLSEYHVAFGIQSNIHMPAARRLALANKLKVAAGTL